MCSMPFDSWKQARIEARILLGDALRARILASLAEKSDLSAGSPHDAVVDLLDLNEAQAFWPGSGRRSCRFLLDRRDKFALGPTY
jgi:hypothetical protein